MQGNMHPLRQPLYFHTDSLHLLMKGSIPYSSICSFPFKPRSFSTSSSTGSPCVSQPALRGTNFPFMVWYLGIISLIVRVSTCPMCGLPCLRNSDSHQLSYTLLTSIDLIKSRSRLFRARAVLFTANFFSAKCASRPEGFLIHRT